MQREHRTRSVFGLERNPSGTRERRREGLQGSRGGVDTSEQSRKLAEGKSTEEGESAGLGWEEELDGAQTIRSAVRYREEGDL